MIFSSGRNRSTVSACLVCRFLALFKKNNFKPGYYHSILSLYIKRGSREKIDKGLDAKLFQQE